MKNSIVAALLVLGCARCGYAGAQNVPQPVNPINDWGGVVLLARGTPISVQVGRHWHSCAFGSANGEWLECSPSLAARPYMFRRINVKKVRFEEKGASTLAGGLIGLGAGIGAGALKGGGSNGYTQEGSMLFGGMLGALFGGAIGHSVPLVHGRVIYEQPAQSASATP